MRKHAKAMSLHVHDCWARSSIENKNPGSISKRNTGIRVMEKLILHRLVLLMDLSMSRILWRSKAHFCLAPSATLTRYVQPKCTKYIWIVKEITYRNSPQKKEKHTAIDASKIGVPRHHFGPPPFHHLGGLSEFSLHLGPREPFGHAVKAAAAFVEAPRSADRDDCCMSAAKTFGEKPPHTEIRMPGRKVQGSGGWFFFWDSLFVAVFKNGKNPGWLTRTSMPRWAGRCGSTNITWSCKKTQKKRVKIYARILANNILKAFHQLNFSETSKDPGVSKVFLQCPLDGFPIQPSKNAYQTATGMLWQSRPYQKETENPWNVWFWEMHL